MEPLIFRRLREDIPNPKQQEFFKASTRHICYGGARGGGKSFAMRRKFVMLAMRYPGLKLLLLRRTMPELRENHILPLMTELAGYAKYRADEKVFIFPNGSRLKLGYCDNEADQLQYQGQEYEIIGFEEATNFEEAWIVFISTCLRTTRTDVTPRIYYTANPGGPAHDYIKRLFVDREYKGNEKPEDYTFIPATVFDNKVLMEADPDYIKQLEALPERLRRGHLYGDWNTYDGLVFEEWKNDRDHYQDRTWTHVIDPFEVPEGWRIYRGFDFGYAKPFSVGWWAVDFDGRLYRILELYGCTEEPNTGVKWSPDEIFREVKRVETEHRWLKGKHIYGIADPSIWDASRGVSVAETGERLGVYFEPGDNHRLPGWLQMHYRLRFDDNGIPMMYIFSTCKSFIRTIPRLQYDKIRPEDIDTDLEDHIADETRYICMARPITPPKAEKTKPKPYDPLSTDDGEVYDSYSFYRKY